MTRLVAILVTLFLVIPAKADVYLRPVPGWTVIQVYGLIKPADVRTFESYTENVNPDATLVILASRGGYLAAGIDIGMRVHLKKLIVGVMGTCASSCALIWIGGETGRKFFYPGSSLCVHQAFNIKRESDYILPRRIPSAPGNVLVSEYLTKLGYNQDMIEWATAADPQNIRCLDPELAKKFNIDLWYNTEDGQHYTLPGNHGWLPGLPQVSSAPPLSKGDGATAFNPSLPNGLIKPAPPLSQWAHPSLPNGWPANPAAPLTKEELERGAFTRCMHLNELDRRACKEDFLKGTQR